MFLSARLYLAIAFLWFIPNSVSAKEDKNPLQAYKKAKHYYQVADYAGAKALLEPLLVEDEPTGLTPYALFYYGLVAYRQADTLLAEHTFKRLYEAFPSWEQRDEVIYWLAQIGFEKGDYPNALAYLNQVRDAGLIAAIKAMKTYFLHQIADIPSLQTLLKQYPDDSVIAQVLLDKFIDQPYIKQDYPLMDSLIQRFKLDSTAWNPCGKLPLVKKERYHVAVLLPFFINELNYEEELTNQFVLSLYKGMLAAVEELAQQGIAIDLHAYDTKKDTTITTALLEQEEMKAMDLMVGPLHANDLPLVAEFAQKHQINLFNPLSVNAQVVGNNPFVYLFKPSLETQARQAAIFTQQDSSASQLGIVYGTSAEDSIKAFTYKQYIEQHTNQEISLMLQLDHQASQQFLNMFRHPSSRQTQKSSLQNLSHIYIASQDELIIANVLSAIEILQLDPYIIGDESWIRQNSITLDQLQRLRLRLVAPDYIDYEKESLQAFRHTFYDRFGHYPSYYESVGYDMMLFLGNMLAQYGVYFQQYWTDQTVPGKIFSGFQYGSHHDNQHVPMVKFQESGLVLSQACFPIQE